jgi:hypothetical protein
LQFEFLCKWESSHCTTLIITMNGKFCVFLTVLTTWICLFHICYREKVF